MRNWILGQLKSREIFLEGQFSQVSQDDPRHGATSKKVLLAGGDWKNFDPNRTTWLGGICSLATADWEEIRSGTIVFPSVASFEEWMKRWYPRIDQLHDAVGIPHKSSPETIYVVEDSFFARRVAQKTGLPEQDLAAVFRQVHQEIGHACVSRWLENYGYHGKVQAVYTSKLENELELAVRLWERKTGKRVNPAGRDWAKVELMYTTIWLDILGLRSGVIAEPMAHLEMSLKNPWESTGLYQIGYFPFWSAGGQTRNLPLPQVTHRTNWKDFQAERHWTAVNLAFNARDPLGFSLEQMQVRALKDLAFVYEGT